MDKQKEGCYNRFLLSAETEDEGQKGRHQLRDPADSGEISKEGPIKSPIRGLEEDFEAGRKYLNYLYAPVAQQDRAQDS